jgi:crotonobetainyl-CoA:carnitine CoA-transferase CaiB-like acyl-CoA transferase
VHTAGSAIAGRESPQSTSQRSLGGAAFYQVYRTADNRHIVLGGREMKFARNLLTALEREDLVPIAEVPAGEQGELIAFLRDTFITKTREDWVQWFADKDVAFAPVLDFRESLDAPHVTERGLVVTNASGGNFIAPPIRFLGENWTPGRVPTLGEGGA